MNPEVRAGGGVVYRRSPSDALEVALVHRPRYDDWSFPKGKCEPDESYRDAAVREVEEETGFRCAVGPELESIGYRDRKGRSKLVRYWAMTVESGAFVVNDEVDELCWLATGEAVERLTYARDRALLDELVRAV